MGISINDVKEVFEKEADDRGRISLGAKYADKTVKVAIVDVEEPSDSSN